jgi:hypothetical protein
MGENTHLHVRLGFAQGANVFDTSCMFLTHVDRTRTI